MAEIIITSLSMLISSLIILVVPKVMISHHFKVSKEKREEFFDKMKSELDEMETRIDKLQFLTQKLSNELEELEDALKRSK